MAAAAACRARQPARLLPACLLSPAQVLAAHPEIQPCADFSSVCGSNMPPPGEVAPGINGSAYACFEWKDRRRATPARLATIKAALLSMVRAPAKAALGAGCSLLTTLHGPPPRRLRPIGCRPPPAPQYPPKLSISLVGGAKASMPTAFALNLCAGASPKPGAPAAVCSYVRPPPPGSANPPPPAGSPDYFWVAGPW